MESVANILEKRAETWEERINSVRNQSEKEFYREVNGEIGMNKGIHIPEAFIVPDEIIDEIMPTLKGAEFKVLMYIVRKTFGFRKYEGDNIPLSQIVSGTKRKDGTYLDRGTGLAKSAVLDALKLLERAGIIKVKRTRTEDGLRQINYYSLNTRTDYTKKRVGGT